MPQSFVKLQVNGVERPVTADEKAPLLYVLRDDLGLTATRFGCGSGQCGACHVLIDGVSVPSCDTPLDSLGDKSITTLEGLAQWGNQARNGVHPLQQAFVDEQAAQCGYCLSGVLIAAAALLSKQPDPTETQVRATLDAHLCRCGSHNRMVRAVLRAARVMKATL